MLGWLSGQAVCQAVLCWSFGPPRELRVSSCLHSTEWCSKGGAMLYTMLLAVTVGCCSNNPNHDLRPHTHTHTHTHTLTRARAHTHATAGTCLLFHVQRCKPTGHAGKLHWVHPSSSRRLNSHETHWQAKFPWKKVRHSNDLIIARCHSNATAAILSAVSHVGVGVGIRVGTTEGSLRASMSHTFVLVLVLEWGQRKARCVRACLTRLCWCWY